MTAPAAGTATPVLPVAAAVLRDRGGRVLITQRPPGKPFAGLWEFPGGKLCAGESARQALARELREELGIGLQRCRLLLRLQHDYGERIVALEVFLVEAYEGEPTGLESQRLQWVSPAQLGSVALLPADAPIADRLRKLHSTEVSEHGAGKRDPGDTAR